MAFRGEFYLQILVDKPLSIRYLRLNITTFLI